MYCVASDRGNTPAPVIQTPQKKTNPHTTRQVGKATQKQNHPHKPPSPIWLKPPVIRKNHSKHSFQSFVKTVFIAGVSALPKRNDPP